MKKIFKLLIITSLIFGLNIAALSANPIDNKTAVGVYAMGAFTNTGTSASGLEFEKWFTPTFAMGIIGSAYYNDTSYTDSSVNVNLQFKYSMINSEMGDSFASRFYAYFVGGYTGWSRTNYYYQTESSERNYYNDAFVSVGFGFEWLLFNHLSLPLNFGFAGRFPEQPNAGFCLGTGIRYSF